MNFRSISMIAVGLLTAMSTTADVVWSGDMYQRTYHDIPSIDMNQDGTDDFTFRREVVPSFDPYYDYFINPANGQIVIDNRFPQSISVSLAEGSIIASSLGNPDTAWENNEQLIFSYGLVMGMTPSYGGLSNREGYLGISFEAEGGTHYGWIHTSHDRNRASPDNEFLYIHGWAYESTPDTPIVAGAIPEPSTGILTMIGSLGLLQFARARRRRKQGIAPIPKCRTVAEPTAPEKW